MAHIVPTFTVVGILLVFHPAHAQYRVQVLGLYQGHSTYATALNNQGDVVGYGFNQQGYQIPLLWTRDQGFVTFLGNVHGAALDINNRGEIIGWYAPGGVGTASVGYLWSEAAGLVELGEFEARRINDAGLIAGRCFQGTADDGACVWDKGIVTRLDNIPGGGSGWAVNARGDVAAYSLIDVERPFLWRKNAGTLELPMPEGALYGIAEGVNARGTVVGWSVSVMPLRHQPRIWNSRGEPQSAPDVNGILTGINNAGVAIGVSPAVRFEDGRAFAWTRGRAVRFLPGGTGSLATDINQPGDIAGVVYEGFTSSAAIWTRHSPPR